MRPDGEHKIYFEDGSLSVNCHYVNGMPHGGYKDYYLSGSLWEHSNHVHGKLHGEYKVYNDDGSMYGHYYYAIGVPVVDLLKEPCDDIALFELQLIHGGELL